VSSEILRMALGAGEKKLRDFSRTECDLPDICP